ncbi:MAG: NUDIX domain-containing protein [Candidatus Moranbacteria bacterium]|nr:NUDIX domain-containing protein [Candidatus Moranbacteria bacterium]
MEDGVHIVSGPTGRTAYVIGRFSPPHKGHILFMVWLLTQVDSLVIGIGSCYEVGVSKHPLLAVFREKMILWSLINEGIDSERVSFVHLQDFPGDFDKWWAHTTGFPGFERVTDYVTGNEEQILSEFRSRGGIPGSLSVINPEKDLAEKFRFPYHATDLRNAILGNDYESFAKIAATGTIALMGSFGGFSMICEALADAGTPFIPGRQTVDIVVRCRSSRGNGKMILCGRRKPSKKDFPGWLAIPGGAIEDYESPMDAAIRELGEETGLDVKIVARHLEPAHVLVNGHIATMRFGKLFSSSDPTLCGTMGGSSQVFCIDLDVTSDVFAEALRSESDLEDVAFRYEYDVLAAGLAYQQSDMVRSTVRI